MAWTEKYVSVAGGGAHDGTSEANAWTLAEAIAAPYATGQRINVIAGTYANTTTTRTFGVAGTAIAPIWWRGYNTTIGDIDTNNALTKPAITFTTGVFSVTGARQWFTNLDISGAGTAALVTMATITRMDRCRIVNSGANAASAAVFFNGHYSQLTRCSLQAGASATNVISSAYIGDVVGCTLKGGGNGINISSGDSFGVYNNVFDDLGASGVTLGATCQVLIIGNSFYSCGADGVRFPAAQANCLLVANNIFEANANYGINNSSGTNIGTIARINNAFYGNITAPENGFGDTPAWGAVTEVASPFTNAAGHDFSLLSTALSKGAGMPAAFEDASYTSYLDIGAVQRQEPAGGAGGRPEFRGGNL